MEFQEINFNLDQLHIPLKSPVPYNIDPETWECYWESLRDFIFPCVFSHNEINKGLNTSNTPSWYMQFTMFGEEVEFHYIPIAENDRNYLIGYKFDFVFHWRTVDAFAVMFWKKTVKTRNTVNIYSSFIQAFSNHYGDNDTWRVRLHDFLENNFLTEDFEDIPSRFDICQDINEDKSRLIQLANENNFEFTSTIKDNQTLYIWHKKHKTMLIRIYDKIADTFEKHKAFLFPFLDKYSNVTRIELEFKNEIKRLFNQTKDNHFDKPTWFNLLTKPALLRSIYYTKLNEKIPFLKAKNFIEYTTKALKKKTFTDDELKEYFLSSGQIPDWHKSNWTWILNKIYKSCGAEWIYQIMFEKLDDKEHQRLIEWLVNITIREKFKKDIRKKMNNEPHELSSLINSLYRAISNDRHAYKYFNKSLSIYSDKKLKS